MKLKNLGRCSLVLSILAIICDIAADSIDEVATERMIDAKINQKMAAIEKKKED